MQCYCCGEERDPSEVSPLLCHDEIKVCRVCIGWLRTSAGVPDSTPILPVRDMADAVGFYERAGFGVEVYEDGGPAFVERDDQSVFDLSVEPELDVAANHAGCYLIVPDVDEWHAQLDRSGLPVTPLDDMPWGMREFTLTDPCGNQVRIGRSVG